MEHMYQVTEPKSNGVSIGGAASQGYAVAVLRPRSAQGIGKTHHTSEPRSSWSMVKTNISCHS